jgi:hypothetical protein
MALNDNVAVGDLSSNARGTGARKNAGKVSFAVVPMHLLAGCARVLMGGLVKYAPWNWAKGMPWSVCFDCAIRHMFKFWYLRQELDKESQCHHIDHAIANLLFLKHYVLSYPEGDDRPPASVGFADLLGDAEFNTLFDYFDYCERNGIDPEDPKGLKKAAQKMETK